MHRVNGSSLETLDKRVYFWGCLKDSVPFKGKDKQEASETSMGYVLQHLFSLERWDTSQDRELGS